MRKSTIALPLGALALAWASVAESAERWTLEEGSAVRFTALQQGQPVEGGFDGFTAEILFDPDDLAASRLDVTIDTASVDTGHKDRDATLRASAFFDVATWPTAHFVSEQLVQTGTDAYDATGELTIRDVTREITLPFQLTIGDHPDATDRRLAEAHGEVTISRLDFGVGQGEWASTATIGEAVVIRIEIRASAPR